VENVENSATEKRRYQRVECNFPLQYKNLRQSSDRLTGSLTRNIGEGGVAFQSSEFISLACRLVVEISLPTISRPIKAISKIAWIKKIPASDQYELGNQFLEMSKEDRAHILDFVNKVVGKNL